MLRVLRSPMTMLQAMRAKKRMIMQATEAGNDTEDIEIKESTPKHASRIRRMPKGTHSQATRLRYHESFATYKLNNQQQSESADKDGSLQDGGFCKHHNKGFQGHRCPPSQLLDVFATEKSMASSHWSMLKDEESPRARDRESRVLRVVHGPPTNK